MVGCIQPLKTFIYIVFGKPEHVSKSVQSASSHREIYAEYLIENSLEFISASDNSGVIIEFNPAASRAFGYTKDEIVGLDASVLYADKKSFDKVMYALDTTGKFSGEVQNKRKNGEIFTCFLSANTLYNDEGEVIGVMGVSRDITLEKELALSQKKAKSQNSELLKEVERLSQIATSVFNGIVITDVSGRMTWCNASFERLTEYTLDELRGKRPSEIFRVPHFFEEEFRELISGGPVFNEPLQIPHYKKNGDMYWVLVESTPVYDKETGKLKQIIEVCTEITDQKKAEIALQESEQNFRQISETIDDVFFLYNLFLKEYEYVSPNCLEILGVEDTYFYEGREFINGYIIEEDRHILRNARMGIPSAIPYDVEYRIELDGERRWIRERAFPIKDADGKVVKGSGVCTDVTVIKENMELIERQNQDINQSIEYAKRIQDATLPDPGEINEIFEDYFVFYEPKGLLSGDFYILDTIATNQGETLSAFVVADCTGHGVPGAILSILCNSLVKQSFSNRDIHSPAQALDLIRSQLNRLFETNDGAQMKDGMDVAFCAYNPDTHKLFFAGANSSCMILRDNEWIELKGDKQHVGYTENAVRFRHQEFDCQKGDRIYLFTDGFSDQFGGPRNKKYLRRKFLDFVKKINKHPLSEQQALLDREFANWKGMNEQTDDVCVLGVQI